MASVLLIGAVCVDTAWLPRKLSAEHQVVSIAALPPADPIRNAVLHVDGGREAVLLPPAALHPDVVLTLLAPDRRLGNLAARFPAAILCAPTAAELDDKDLTPPGALEGEGEGAVLRDGCKPFAAVPRTSAVAAFNHGPGFDVVTVPEAPSTTWRVRVLLDLLRGTVQALPGGWVRRLPQVSGFARPAEVYALAAQPVTDWKHRSTEEVPAAVVAVAVHAADTLLDRPALCGTPTSDRLLPVVEVHVVGDRRPAAVGLRWSSTVAGGLESSGELDTWLAAALPRRRRPPAPLLELPVPADADAGGPLARLLPRLAHTSTTTATRSRPDARVVHLVDAVAENVDALLAAVARDTVPGGTSAAADARVVEPGVGRTYLVTGIDVPGRPDLHDFAVTGGGLTPYSAGGFVSVGSAITGRAALIRLHHRRHSAELLEGVGGRTAPVLLIAELPGDEVPLPDGTRTAAGLMLRGFRCVLRVRQLDPVASYYQSLECAPLVANALVARAGRRLTRGVLDALDAYAGGFDDVRRVLWPRPALGDDDAAARQIRRALVDEYAPLVLSVVRRRLARELGRDPDDEPVHLTEYVAWFASSIGAQLAGWRRIRFLHDYHQPGVRRDNGLVTLVESNVTLLAEFPDLDTAVAVDDETSCDALQLNAREREWLRADYAFFHAREVACARAVVRSLALAASACDERMAGWADSHFDRAYAVGVPS